MVNNIEIFYVFNTPFHIITMLVKLLNRMITVTLADCCKSCKFLDLLFYFVKKQIPKQFVHLYLNKPDFLHMWRDTDGINPYNEVTCRN